MDKYRFCYCQAHEKIKNIVNFLSTRRQSRASFFLCLAELSIVSKYIVVYCVDAKAQRLLSYGFLQYLLPVLQNVYLPEDCGNLIHFEVVQCLDWMLDYLFSSFSFTLSCSGNFADLWNHVSQ